MVDFATARRRMVDNQLRTSAVTDRRILAAIEEIPRERFIPDSRQALAYADVAHDLGCGRFLPPATPFARLLQLAEIAHTDAVLDIGCGTGYSAAVLSRLAATVTALDADPDLVAAAKLRLAELGATNVTVVEGALTGVGQPGAAFDVVVLEGAVAAVPEQLFALLRDGGRLVALLQGSGEGVAHVYVRAGNEVADRPEFNAALPPLFAAKRPETFVFCASMQ